MTDNDRKDPAGLGNYKGDGDGGEWLLLLLLCLFAISVVVYAVFG
jgi:hypothetical protein